MKNGAQEFFAKYNITPADELDYSDAHREHRHVSIDIAGRTITLDLIAFEDHISIDVRAFGDEYNEDTSTGLPIGVFGIEKGFSTELPETDSKAHGWNALRMPILLVETEDA